MLGGPKHGHFLENDCAYFVVPSYAPDVMTGFEAWSASASEDILLSTYRLKKVYSPSCSLKYDVSIRLYVHDSVPDAAITRMFHNSFFEVPELGKSEYYYPLFKRLINSAYKVAG